MSGRPFRLEELADTSSTLPTAELSESLSVAREIEGLAAQDIASTEGFADRVMEAIAAEPVPSPLSAVAAAARGGRFSTALAALADSWRVAWGAGRPLAIRAQSFAVVLVALMAIGSMSGLALVGGWNALGPARSPDLSPVGSPSTGPSFTAPALAPATPSPALTPEPSEGPSESAEPSDSAEPSETPEATSGSGSETTRPTSTPKVTSTARPTARPTPTPGPSNTPEPTATPDLSGEDHGATPAPTSGS